MDDLDNGWTSISRDIVLLKPYFKHPSLKMENKLVIDKINHNNNRHIEGNLHGVLNSLFARPLCDLSMNVRGSIRDYLHIIQDFHSHNVSLLPIVNKQKTQHKTLFILGPYQLDMPTQEITAHKKLKAVDNFQGCKISHSRQSDDSKVSSADQCQGIKVQIIPMLHTCQPNYMGKR